MSEGDAEAALAASEFRVDATYRTPRYNQNAIELHTTIATWTGDDTLDLHDSTQSLSLTRTTLARVFGILLRKRNEPDRDPTKGTEFSSRHLVAAYQRGADAFG